MLTKHIVASLWLAKPSGGTRRALSASLSVGMQVRDVVKRCEVDPWLLSKTNRKLVANFKNTQ
jgi:hypothetical protein